MCVNLVYGDCRLVDNNEGKETFERKSLNDIYVMCITQLVPIRVCGVSEYTYTCVSLKM